MRIRAREGPFLHRRPIRRIDCESAPGSEDAARLRNIAAIPIEEINHVDHQDFVKRAGDPRKSTERAPNDLQPPLLYRRRIPSRRLAEHELGMIDTENLAARRLRKETAEALTRSEPDVEHDVVG